MRQIAALTLVLPLTSCGIGIDSKLGPNPSGCTMASAWTTSEKLDLGGDHSTIMRLAVGPSGTVYALGQANSTPAALSHWIARASTDAGRSWTTFDDYLPALSSDSALARDVLEAPDGSLYLVGMSKVSSNPRWIVRKRASPAASFAVADDFVSSGKALAAGIRFFGGQFVVAGDGGSPQLRWLTRTSPDGATWSAGDDFLLGTGDESSVHFMSADPSGALLVVGGVAEENAGGKQRWLVRISTDGTAWSTSDKFSLDSNKESSAEGGLVLGSRIWVTGYAIDANDRAHWIVRASVDGGATWATSDDFQPANQQGESKGVALDLQGNAYAVGSLSDGSGFVHQLVRRSRDGLSGWTTIEDFQLASGKDTNASSIASDALGNLYVSSNAKDSSDNMNWIVRKLPCE